MRKGLGRGTFPMGSPPVPYLVSQGDGAWATDRHTGE
jgi:hypothetical protein